MYLRCISSPYCQTYLQGKLTSVTTFLALASSTVQTDGEPQTQTTNESVSSGDTPGNTTDNQELSTAVSDQTTEGDPCILVRGEMALIDIYVLNS